MTDTEVTKSSSLEDLSFLELADCIEIEDTVEEDDLSRYIINHGTRQSSTHLQVPSWLAESDSVSPPSTLTPLPSFDFGEIPDLFEDYSFAPEENNQSPAKTVDESLNWIYSSALKEELRYKIQLKRVTSGQEELKVDFTSPDTTICFDTVKKRNEVREKNKEYAKQSRDRVKLERTKQEEENKKLKLLNMKLKHEIINLKQKMLATKGFLQNHHGACSKCCRVEGACSICTETTLPAVADLKNSQEPVKTAHGLTKTCGLGPQPGPSGLSKGKTYFSSSETGHVSGDVHATSHGERHLKVWTETVHERPTVILREYTTSSRDEKKTQDGSYQDTLLKVKRCVAVSNPKKQFDEEIPSSKDHIWIEFDKDHDTLLKGKRRAGVSIPTEQFDEEIPSVMKVFEEDYYRLNSPYYLDTFLTGKRRAVVSKSKENFQDKILFLLQQAEIEDIDDQNSAWMVNPKVSGHKATVSNLDNPETKDKSTVSNLDHPETKDVNYQNTERSIQPHAIVSIENITGHKQVASSMDYTERDDVKDLDIAEVVKRPAIVSSPKTRGHVKLLSSMDYTWREDEKDLDTLIREKQRTFVSNPVEQIGEDLKTPNILDLMDILDHG